MSKKLDEANGHMAAGDKEASSGFFKRPSWEAAAGSYAKAATAFKVAKERDACVAAHLKAAAAYGECGAKFQAGKHLEQAAREVAKSHEAVPLLRKAALLFRENGNGEKGAQCLSEAAARAEEAHLLDEAVLLYQESIDVNEGEGRTESKTLGALLSCLVKTGNLAAAGKQCEAQCELWSKKGNAGEAHRCANSRLVLHLAQDDGVAAERWLQRAMGEVPGYMESDASRYGMELVEAVRGDGTALAALQQSSKFRYLEASIVRLFRELKATGAAPKEGEEEDLT